MRSIVPESFERGVGAPAFAPSAFSHFENLSLITVQLLSRLYAREGDESSAKLYAVLK
jgi:hypothetical protein